MSKILALFVIAAGFALPLTAFALTEAKECPASNSEMMRHFGRSLLKADTIVFRGENDPSAVSDDDIKAAITGIENGASCASLVFEDCNIELLPPRLREDPGPFREHMKIFVDALNAYKAMFAAQLLLPPAKRDFSEIAAQKKAITDIANEAHKVL